MQILENSNIRQAMKILNKFGSKTIIVINNKNKLITQFIDTYNYDRGLNVKIQNFLQEMDARRGTDSKTVTPWCYV